MVRMPIITAVAAAARVQSLPWEFPHAVSAAKKKKNGHHKKKKNLQIKNAGECVGKREGSYTIGINVSWCNHYGKQYGGSLKN